jgi:flagellar motor protein MotB
VSPYETRADDGDEDGIDGSRPAAPVWAVFGDLMAGLVGAFVLVLVGVLAMQMDLASNLQSEVAKRRAEEQRRMSLEKALAVPLAAGRVTLVNGRIGISGSVLFPNNSDELRPEGRELLKGLVQPLRSYLEGRDEMLMVSGFTDDRPIQHGNQRFDDNLELSAQRALTVTRALVDEGMPAARLFAAAFGAEQPVASNNNESGRTLNRRVEVAPVPRAPTPQAATKK